MIKVSHNFGKLRKFINLRELQDTKTAQKSKVIPSLLALYFLLLSGLCGLHYVDTEIGQVQHYRRDCYQNPCPLAESVVRDDRVWTHLDTVISNSKKALKTINFEHNV